MDRPTHARHWVVVFAVTLALISYTDRVVIAQAATNIQAELSLSRIQMGWVFFVFSWAYTAFEIPGGGWVTAGAPGSFSFGSSRCGPSSPPQPAGPGTTSRCSSARCPLWRGRSGLLPQPVEDVQELAARPRAHAGPGTHVVRRALGRSHHPFLVALLLQHVSWRRAFEMFGVLGVVWGAFFLWWFEDRPRDHPSVNAAELALIPEAHVPTEREDTPWRAIFANRSVLLLLLQYFLLSYGWWFYIQWLPTYLKEARGLALAKDQLKGAVLAGLPLFLGGIGCWLSGFVEPHLARQLRDGAGPARAGSLGPRSHRRPPVRLHPAARHPVLAMLAMGLAGFANDLTVPVSWGVCMDVGGRHTGTVSGGMNMMGAGGGAVAGPMVAYLLRRFRRRLEPPALRRRRSLLRGDGPLARDRSRDADRPSGRRPPPGGLLLSRPSSDPRTALLHSSCLSLVSALRPGRRRRSRRCTRTPRPRWEPEGQHRARCNRG